jgi:hypothetical protein
MSAAQLDGGTAAGDGRDLNVSRCARCGATGEYDDSAGFYLLAWWRASERFREQHRACTPLAADDDAAPAGDGRGR